MTSYNKQWFRYISDISRKITNIICGGDFLSNIRTKFFTYIYHLLDDENKNSPHYIDGLTFLDPSRNILKHFGQLFITLYENTDLISTYSPLWQKYALLGQKWLFSAKMNQKSIPLTIKLHNWGWKHV